MTDSHVHKINRDLIIGWMAIVVILFVSYTGEVIKGQRTISYLVIFMTVAALPALICLVMYKMRPESKKLRYGIVLGYSFFYIFSMLTGKTELICTYILPMLSLLVLYHQPRLILLDGAISLCVNVFYVSRLWMSGTLNTMNTKDLEIQIALLILCFAGSYTATRLFDSITKENEAYVKELDDKNIQIQKMTLQSIMTIANTIDAKDEYTRGHSKRVADYTVAIARRMGMEDDEVEQYRFVALLHDIGKIGVPDSVLNKPGKLTDEEYGIMKQHTVIGADILKDSTTFQGISLGALYHHERYDGRGYPDGLKGEEIPLVARIIAVADAYDAMTSNRVYRKHLNSDKVMRELENGLGNQFDPVAGQALIDLIQEGKISMHKPSDKEKAWQEEDEKTENPDDFDVLDELTGLYKRTVGEKVLRQQMREENGSLVIFNIDQFWNVSETVGFMRGDMVLKMIVDAILNLPAEKTLYRSKGDEFIAYFPKITEESKVSELLENFYEQIKDIRSVNEDLSILSISAGVAMNFDYAKFGAGDVYSQADKALYHAKQQGGGRYCFHNSSREQKEKPSLTKVDLEELIRHIRDKENYSGGFQVEYPEFARIYELIRRVSERNNKEIQIVMFTIIPADEKSISLEEREYIMGIMKKAVVGNIRGEDVTTKYSSTQRIVLLVGLTKEQIEIVTGRILKDFYRMYDKKQVSVHYDIAELKG